MSASVWWPDGPAIPLPALTRDETADVCVVGAGITGLTTALLLARRGLSVVVVEAGRVGSGTTGSTSAHLTVATDVPLDELQKRVGEESAAMAVRAGRIGIDRIDALDREMRNVSDLVAAPGYLWARTAEEADRIDAMAHVYARYGETAVSGAEVPQLGLRRGLRLDRQAMFHPGKYMAGLLELVLRAGVRVYEGSAVTDWGGGPARAVTRGGTVTARHLVLATHTPPGLVAALQTRLAPFVSFVVAGRGAILPEGLYWDLAKPYHYIRTMRDGRLVIGGEDLKPGTGQEFTALDHLSTWARDNLDVTVVEQRWSHMVFESPDGLPYIGRVPGHDDVWVGTGFAGTGLTWGSYAAERITEGITAEPSDDDRRFSPSRLAVVASAERVLAAGIETLWHMVADRLRPSGDLHPQDLAAGDGRVLTIEGRKVGVYRDHDGSLHAVSTVCRHLGCIVAWNPMDRTWDCPCHGGRYKADGTRCWGPPMGNLETRKIE